MSTAEVPPPLIFELDIFVPSAEADMGCRAGSPAAQGSKRYVGHRRNRRTGKLAPLLLEQSTAVKPWRERVAEVAAMYWRGRPLLTRAIGTRLSFVMPRPSGTSKRSTPPAIKRPDCDKLSRSIFDALTGVVWRDDSLVVDLHATKRIAEVGERPGCRVQVWSLE